MCLLLAHAISIEARGMWGSRRKKGDDDDEDAVVMNEAIKGFETKRRRMESSQVASDGSLLRSGSSLTSKIAQKSDTIMRVFNQYLEMMDSMLSDPNYDSMINPETIRTMFSQVPGLSAYPELTTLLESPQFSDPVELKKTVNEGVKAMRMFSSQLELMLSDPAQVEQLLQQLPPEASQLITSVLSGDTESLKNMLNEIPGLQPAQKKMLTSMLDGDMDAITDSVKSMLTDPDQLEKARQEMLNNPEMLEMLGLSIDQVKDDEKWAQLMADGKNKLFAEELKDSKRKFAGNLDA